MAKVNYDNQKYFLQLVKTGLLSVSREGIIFNTKTGNQLAKKPNSDGYAMIGVRKGRKVLHQLVHRLVYLLYGEIELNDEFDIINHKDGNKFNNSISNLEITNNSGNVLHARNILNLGESIDRKVSRALSGDKASSSKISNEEAEQIRSLYRQGVKVKDLCKRYGLHRTNIYRITHKQSYK